jgi:hypothetical protein
MRTISNRSGSYPIANPQRTHCAFSKYTSLPHAQRNLFIGVLPERYNGKLGTLFDGLCEGPSKKIASAERNQSYLPILSPEQHGRGLMHRFDRETNSTAFTVSIILGTASQKQKDITFYNAASKIVLPGGHPRAGAA